MHSPVQSPNRERSPQSRRQGNQHEGGPVIVPALDTFTRNLKFHTYFRAGTGFTANGVGQTFAFNTPDVSFGKTQRLGNEILTTYIETGPIWDHMLGDDPDAIDVKAKMTFTISDGVDKQVGADLTMTALISEW